MDWFQVKKKATFDLDIDGGCIFEQIEYQVQVSLGRSIPKCRNHFDNETNKPGFLSKMVVDIPEKPEKGAKRLKKEKKIEKKISGLFGP